MVYILKSMIYVSLLILLFSLKIAKHINHDYGLQYNQSYFSKQGGRERMMMKSSINYPTCTHIM